MLRAPLERISSSSVRVDFTPPPRPPLFHHQPSPPTPKDSSSSAVGLRNHRPLRIRGRLSVLTGKITSPPRPPKNASSEHLAGCCTLQHCATGWNTHRTRAWGQESAQLGCLVRNRASVEVLEVGVEGVREGLRRVPSSDTLEAEVPPLEADGSWPEGGVIYAADLSAAT